MENTGITKKIHLKADCFHDWFNLDETSKIVQLPHCIIAAKLHLNSYSFNIHKLKILYLWNLRTLKNESWIMVTYIKGTFYQVIVLSYKKQSVLKYIQPKTNKIKQKSQKLIMKHDYNKCINCSIRNTKITKKYLPKCILDHTNAKRNKYTLCMT